ncbi:hypothetical protein C8Q74DRAFT_1281249 [Fomes fomentarius]|nr:hypothetical protein C8Q74DRAFT_1281249 [Fomes fomentarius]
MRTRLTMRCATSTPDKQHRCKPNRNTVICCWTPLEAHMCTRIFTAKQQTEVQNNWVAHATQTVTTYSP